MKRPVITIPDPRLIATSAPAEINHHAIVLAHDLRETMRALDGLGLAAPQIGVNVRICVVSVNKTGFPFFALYNPEIIWRSEERDVKWETCFSIPGQGVQVSRPSAIKVRFQTRDGIWLERPARGLAARVIQHEIDHFDGVLLGLKWRQEIGELPKGVVHGR